MYDMRDYGFDIPERTGFVTRKFIEPAGVKAIGLACRRCGFLIGDRPVDEPCACPICGAPVVADVLCT